MLDSFAVLAEPTRRRILDNLRAAERSVGELVGSLELPQPTVSKHLRVLRDAGLVSSQVRAQQRVYRIEHGPLADVDAWLRPYRELWESSLEALARHLDAVTTPDGRTIEHE